MNNINLSQKAEVGKVSWDSVARKQPDDDPALLLAAANSSRTTLLIQNVGTVDVYLGGSGVTALTGLLLSAGSWLTDDISNNAWYGITVAGTADLRVLEVHAS